jgi:hypothetical protein
MKTLVQEVENALGDPGWQDLPLLRRLATLGGTEYLALPLAPGDDHLQIAVHRPLLRFSVKRHLAIDEPNRATVGVGSRLD